MRAALGAVLLLLAASVSVAQPTYELAVDVPSVLGGTSVVPRQVARHAGASYATVVTLPPQVAIGALQRRSDGAILFAPVHPVVLDGSTFEPRDVVVYDGKSYALTFDGSAGGVPDNARIDALMLDPDGALELSFDVPVRLADVWRGRSNLMRYDGAWTQTWDAAAAGVPASVNLIGADRSSAGMLVVTFDIPVRIGGTWYRPGQLVGWDGESFADVATDAAWPPSAELRDFSFLPSAGAIAASLRVDKTAGPDLALTWGPSCAGSDSDYEVYEGSIAAGFNSHAPALCSTSGSTSAVLAANAGDRYFLVVPRNAVAEGSYGTLSNGIERPAATIACLPESVAACGAH